jgi:hypothetical protein
MEESPCRCVCDAHPSDCTCGVRGCVRHTPFNCDRAIEWPANDYDDGERWTTWV